MTILLNLSQMKFIYLKTLLKRKELEHMRLFIIFKGEMNFQVTNSRCFIVPTFQLYLSIYVITRNNMIILRKVD